MQKATSPAGSASATDAPATYARAGALLSLISRVEEVIEAETASIRTDPGFDIRASNTRKSRHLHELGRAFRNVDPAALNAEHRTALSRLRERLSVNEAAIQAHLGAVGEVATLLRQAAERAQADGTYSVREFGQR